MATNHKQIKRPRILLDVRVTLTDENKSLVEYIAQQARDNFRTIQQQVRWMLDQEASNASAGTNRANS